MSDVRGSEKQDEAVIEEALKNERRREIIKEEPLPMNKNQSSRDMISKNKNTGSDIQKVKPLAGIFFNIMGSIRQPLLVLDNKLRILKANYFFYQMFSIKPQDAEGKVIYDLDNRQWDIPELKELLEEILTKNSDFKDFKLDHQFASVGRKILYLNAKQLVRKSGQVELILLSIEDVTEREDQKRILEDLVKIRTAELNVAKGESEKRKQIAETALAETLQLKAQLEEIGRAHV